MQPELINTCLAVHFVAQILDCWCASLVTQVQFLVFQLLQGEKPIGCCQPSLFVFEHVQTFDGCEVPTSLQPRQTIMMNDFSDKRRKQEGAEL